MAKYWLLLVLCGGLGGCAVSPAEDSGSNDDAVILADKPNARKGKSNDATDHKGNSATDEKGCPGSSGGAGPTNPPDACTQALYGLKLQIDAAAKAGDGKLVAALYEKYWALASSCETPTKPVDPCTDEAFYSLKLQIEAAIKAGDQKLTAALYEKYNALHASCFPPTKPVDPCTDEAFYSLK